MTQGVQKLNGNLKPAIAIRAVQLALNCTCSILLQMLLNTVVQIQD